MRFLLAALVLAAASLAQAAPPHVVFLIGEAEYGSEVTMPAFGSRLEHELGLRVTVLQSTDGRLPPLDLLDSADLLVLFLRFRQASDAQFERLRAWFDAGRPCVALRTTSHAFTADKGWFPPFFGGHYKAHAPNGQGTTSYVLPAANGHPILRGIAPVVEMGHGGTYNAQPLADTAVPLLLGRTGRLPSEPIAWTNRYRSESRIFYTSLGSRENFARDDFQRLLGNAVLWCLSREVPPGGAFAGGAARVPLAVSDLPPAPPLRAPDDATLLFAGLDTRAWQHWDPSLPPLAIGIDGRADTSGGGERYDAARWPVADSALVARPGFGDAVTRESFGDYQLHLDFLVPRQPGWGGDGFAGRSGVYLAGRYEIEIADSFGGAADQFSCGAIYGQRAPDENAALPAGQWQTLDVHFRHLQDRAPVVSAWLNGRQIHDRVSLRERTIQGFLRPEPGARSVARGEGLLVARPPGESFQFGNGQFAIAARFRTKGDGTLAAKAPPAGDWQPDAKALFLRGGRLVYDIGWVGQMQSKQRFDDGRWHRVLLTHGDGAARMFVDGALAAERAGFVRQDAPGHVFKIGAASPNFAGPYAGELSDVTVFEHNVAADKATQWTRGEVVHLGEPTFAWQPPAADPDANAAAAAATAAAPDRVVVAGPIRLQADSSAVRFANIWLRPLAAVDHRRLIAARDDRALARGAKLYAVLCTECHAARPRTAFPRLTHGDDPLSMYDTLEHGSPTAPAMAWIPPGPRYDVIHYVRDDLQLPAVDAAYLAALPAGMAEDEAPSPPDETSWPPYRRMDYGNVLHWTYEVAADNIAQKAIAVRLDAGPGGVSRGRAFVAYDHDTMRVAAAWTGAGFIDWKGVAFDASHNSHAHVDGDVAFVNPVGPGWADPQTGSFDDPRPTGRDDRPYGPLPRSWLQYRGRHQRADRTVLEYTVGASTVLDCPTIERGAVDVFARTLEVGPAQQALAMRIAPATVPVTLRDADDAALQLSVVDGFHVLHIAPRERPALGKLLIGAGDERLLTIHRVAFSPPVERLSGLLGGGPAQWQRTVTTQAQLGAVDGPYATDTLTLPEDDDNPWRSWMRLGGFDFFADGDRAAVSTWNGDVWTVAGLAGDRGDLAELRWRRIAAGLYQPLGVKIVDDVIYVGCRDQICVLEDRNGDGETDFYRCFNNDHQVTEHFHEFAMGLQRDAAGNFYYAKSARHALPALVPHHGTLLRVASDGSHTDIVANGFRAANGVCVNDDGSFYVTDQEGHWTPKNRINRVVEGGFYGNMMGYHDRTSSADADMEQPLCWITNAFDRSPAELVRVLGDRWGLPQGALLEISYGMGRVFLVLEDQVGDVHQGGMVALPLEPLPTGVMRGRFHEPSGQLYCCGLFGWSGARTRPGGFYRIRYTGGPVTMPTAMHAVAGGIQLTFGCDLDREIAEDPDSYGIKTWQLRRARSYGSEHHDTQQLPVVSAELLADGRTVRLEIPQLAPTMCIEVLGNLESTDGQRLRAVIHGTLHAVR